jgi:hypothetical protein
MRSGRKASIRRVQRLVALLVVVAGTAAALPVLAGGTILGIGARPVASIALAPAGSHGAGDQVTVVGRSNPLPRGDRLLLERRSGVTWVSLAECARTVCSGTWTEADEVTVAFRARVVHRRSITRGPITAVHATSRVATAHWTAPAPPPPPPPPRPPAAKAGKYCGFNDQGRTVCLDVGADGLTVTSFATQSIVTCSDGSQWAWLLSFGGRSVPIANLAFTYTYSGPLSSSGSSLANIQTTYTLSGTFDQAGNAQGTIALSKISWDQGGTHYDCSSAPYGWHARLGA